MLWIKVLHIIFVFAWLIGLFYLPRLYVNLAVETHPVAKERLLLMARKLFRFMTAMSIPALGFGLELWLGFGIGQHQGWLHAKLSVVLLLIAYHIACGKQLSAFEQGRRLHSHQWYRVFNELPTFALLTVLVLVVVKPF